MKWKIQGKVYDLPFDDKEDVLKFVNIDIKVCPYCGKVDCTLEHVSNCNAELAEAEQLRRDNLRK